MYLERKQSLSIYYWLEDLFSGDSVSIVDAWDDGDLETPRIAIQGGDIVSEPLELGGTDRYERVWYLQIYGNTKQQRDEISYKVFGELRSNSTITVYDYDEGFPPSVSPSSLGYLETLAHTYRPRDLDSDLQMELDWRGKVAVHTEYIVNN